MPHRALKWLAATLAALLALPLLAALGLALFGFNWARGPLQQQVLQKTGRALHIGGDLGLRPGWPIALVRAQDLRFANPGWAAAPQMLRAEAVEISVDLRELLRGRLVFPQLRLQRPQVFLEQASGGRKTWLLDRLQTDEAVRIPIGRMLLDDGEIHYRDAAQGTAVDAHLSTVGSPGAADDASARSLVFQASGQLRGQALVAEGSGGAVLAWRDETRPYPLQLRATLGRTQVQASGSVTGLLRLRQMDLQLALQGDSLATLYPLIGIALPPTPAYRSSGRLLRQGALWRYEAFAGQVGHSDLAGTLQVVTGGARPQLSGTLQSRRLDLADLGPAVGARGKASAAPGLASAAGPRPAAPALAAPLPTPADRLPGAQRRLLPDLPLNTASWASLDADVRLTAQTLQHAQTPPHALPLEKLQLRLLLKDRRLTLDPLQFELAGGQFQARLSLDGAAQPLQGQLKAQLRGLMLGRLLPTLNLGANSIGRLDGDADLSGQGASVGRLLAGANGRLSLVAQDGRISRLLMEKIGLHLLEILRFQLTGDQTVALRCAVADFDVAHGVMQARALLLDTEVNTLSGSGRIDLAQERLDLRLQPRTKVSSLVALRGPIYLRGSFSQPVVQLDTGRIAARSAGALALGLLNPLLALIPLFEAGPGVDGACARLLQEARAPGPRAGPAASARPGARP